MSFNLKNIIAFLLLGLSVFISSCSVQKRHYLNGYTVSWKKSMANSSNDKELIASNEENMPIIDEMKKDKFESTINLKQTKIDSIHLNKTPFSDSIKCDKLLFKNGEEINVKVTEITPSEIKYKKCDFPTGPIYTSTKNEVFMVKYSNGSKDVFNEEKTTQTKNSVNNNDELRTNGFAIAGFVLSLLGVSILGIIFSAIGDSQIKKNPTKWKDNGMATAGIILGIIGLIILIIVVGL